MPGLNLIALFVLLSAALCVGTLVGGGRLVLSLQERRGKQVVNRLRLRGGGGEGDKLAKDLASKINLGREQWESWCDAGGQDPLVEGPAPPLPPDDEVRPHPQPLKRGCHFARPASSMCSIKIRDPRWI